MSDGSVDHGDHKQTLSALMDGELDVNAVQRACAAWREDADVRARWHAYHLVGDLLRSEETRVDAGHDSEFLARLRSRLADEPVVLAPQPRAVPLEEERVHVANGVPRVRRRAWAAPFAVAAGFVAVAGVLVVTRVGGPTPGAPAAASTFAAATLPAVETNAVAASASLAAADDNIDLASAAPETKVVRDPRLDRYLAAHRQYAMTLAVPGVTLRNAAAYEFEH